MNNRSLVRLSNTIGKISIVLLIYWVFIFIIISVFGLRVFAERLTDTFYLSVVGILSLMFGALIINVMFNLTRIADRNEPGQEKQQGRNGKKRNLWFLLSFPVLFALLLGGDWLSSRKKERMLLGSAQAIVENDTIKTNHLAAYRFDKEWINKTGEILDVFSRTDPNFPQVEVIVADTMDGNSIYLGFERYMHYDSDTAVLSKRAFIRPATLEERNYLDAVFTGSTERSRFRAKDGNYQLFYPYVQGGRTVVFFFADHQRYGKIGS